MKKPIFLSVPNFSGKELDFVTKAVESEWVSTAGKYIEDFEKNIAEYLNISHSAACQSGTAGLHLALKVCGVEANDLVLVPTLTFVASINPVKYLNADPVFMDCDDSLTIDPQKIEQFCKTQCYIKNNTLIHLGTKRIVRAVVVVHVFGNIAGMSEIMKIAKRYHLKVIEDAAEALGSKFIEGQYKGKFAGTIGDIGVYSFNGNKIITTGGGGMIVSNSTEYIAKCKHLSTQAKSDALYFDHDEIGFNYRMTNIQAALGLAQLEQLENFIEKKRVNYELYCEEGINLLPFRKNIRSNFWFYSFVSKNRDQLIKYLWDEGIQTRPVWKLIHTLKPYENCMAYKIEKAKDYYKLIVNLPCSSGMSNAEVQYVAKKIKFFVQKSS